MATRKNSAFGKTARRKVALANLQARTTSPHADPQLDSKWKEKRDAEIAVLTSRI